MAKTLESFTTKKLVLTAGRGGEELAQEIAYYLGIELLPTVFRDFANGEIYVQYLDSVRGRNVFVIQGHTDPINKNIMENFIMLDALKRASAKTITVVLPYLGYARQDKKHNSREPITARLVVDLLKTAGADRLVTLDLHSDQIQGFFDGPVDHLEALPVLVKWVKKNVKDLKNITVVSPDAGRTKGSEKWAAALGGAKVAFVHKTRDPNKPNKSVSDVVVGDIKGRTCLITDDMIDTGGTIINSIELLKAEGAKQIYVLATHGVFSGDAPEALQKCAAKAIVVTNSLPIGKSKQFKKLQVLSIAPRIADAINTIFEEKSLGASFVSF